MIVSNIAIEAEGLTEFFKNLGKNRLKESKKMAKNVLENPGRALEIGANVGSAFVSLSPKAVLSSIPEVMSFYHSGNGLNLGKFVLVILNNDNKKQNDYINLHL